MLNFLGLRVSEIVGAEAARILGVDKRTVKKWVKNGILKPKRVVRLEYNVFDKVYIQSVAKKLPKDRHKGVPILPR